MKLYAKTTSERASKGQGGNKYLINDIFISDRIEPDYKIETRVLDGKIETIILKRKMFHNSIREKYTEIHKDIIYINEEKGKRQKGEQCIDCNENIDNTKNCISCKHKRCLNCCQNR